MENIKKNREHLLLKIKEIHHKSFYSRNDIPKLVAVSKQQEDFKIEKAIKCGQRIFGENRVQEAFLRWEKRIEINYNIELRMIGPLQTNKVKQALGLFNVIETIDREKLANEISKNFCNEVRTKSFYVQINTGNESQKAGLDPLEADTFIKYCVNDLRLPIIGLMCIPPIDEESSMHFALLNKIATRNNLKELSMGMSNDYEDAIKFGASSVRIGSLFFGKRPV